MALNIKNPEVERLAAEQARLTGQSKTETIRLALLARREQLAHQAGVGRRGESFLRFLEEEVWPRVPPQVLGRRLTRREKEEILGYGAEGV
jgi:antitoxin VapB